VRGCFFTVDHINYKLYFFKIIIKGRFFLARQLGMGYNKKIVCFGLTEELQTERG
jgi:hypothetical protein